MWQLQPASNKSAVYESRQLKPHLFQLSYPHLIFDRLTCIVTVVLVVMFVIYATLKITYLLTYWSWVLLPVVI